MGGHSSKSKNRTLVIPGCPPECSEKDYRKILKLFDQLDGDGTFTIESSEKGVLKIARLHIENRLRGARQKKDIMEQNHARAIERREQEFRKEIELMKQQQTLQTVRLRERIHQYETMNDADKCQEFVRVVSGDTGQITIEMFVDYMKTRIQDLQLE